jgi:hypothetical protein
MIETSLPKLASLPFYDVASDRSQMKRWVYFCFSCKLFLPPTVCLMNHIETKLLSLLIQDSSDDNLIQVLMCMTTKHRWARRYREEETQIRMTVLDQTWLSFPVLPLFSLKTESKGSQTEEMRFLSPWITAENVQEYVRILLEDGRHSWGK